MSKTFGERLKSARTSLKLTQKELASKIDAKHNSISDWENNKNKPDPDTIELLCGVLGITPNYLLGTGNDDALFPHEKTLIVKYRQLDAHGVKMVNMVLEEEYTRSISIQEPIEQEESNLIHIPASPYKASAGEGTFLFDEEPDTIIGVINNSDTRKADICITVAGDSMEPVYFDGDILLVRRQPDIDIGEIGIFIQAGRGFVKKKGEDRLISLNKLRPDIYPSEFDEIYCFGKVIGKLEPEWIVKK